MNCLNVATHVNWWRHAQPPGYSVKALKSTGPCMVCSPWVFLSGLVAIDGIGYRPVLELCQRFQYHIGESAKIVSSEQVCLCVCVHVCVGRKAGAIETFFHSRKNKILKAPYLCHCNFIDKLPLQFLSSSWFQHWSGFDAVWLLLCPQTLHVVFSICKPLFFPLAWSPLLSTDIDGLITYVCRKLKG